MRTQEGEEAGTRRRKVIHSLAVDVSVNFSSPGAPLRAPVFLLALFSTKNVPQKLISNGNENNKGKDDLEN